MTARIHDAIASAPLRIASLVVAVAAGPGPALAWGPTIHQRVVVEAVDTLPKPLKGFYKDHRSELPSLAEDAEPVEEGPERRFAADRVTSFPFLDLPRTEAAVDARVGDDSGAVGRLPWLIDEAYERLVAAFAARDKSAILTASDSLAGYVADLHNPLAVTRNYDGQLTDQHGLWVRFTLKLPDAMEKRLKLRSDAAILLDRPQDYVFSMVDASYIWIDNLLYQEELSRRGRGGYTELYYDALADRAGGILEERLGSAATDVGSYWYSAWTAAGRPALP